MLNLPRQTLDKVQKYLLKQQKEVKEQIEAIEKDDPLTVDAIPEASESGTESWQSEVHNRISTLKEDLSELANKVSKALKRIQSGTYGKCESCGNIIETKRIEAMPVAHLCLSCSRQDAKVIAAKKK